jgi:hypothetical protein
VAFDISAPAIERVDTASMSGYTLRMARAAAPGATGGALVWGLFVRAIAICYGVTFLSEARQMLGLVGSRGILPIAEFIHVAAEQLSAPYRYVRLPTLFWLNASDAFIAAVPWLGALAALVAFIGIGSRACLLICYALHQSTVVAGGDFFFYPWDLLLLEATVLTLFVPSLRRLPSASASGAPPPIVALAIYFLLFRLQFGMGVHKFFDSIDERWRQLTYIYHWQQWQPMPTGSAWYAFHYLPMWMHKCMAGLTFVAEVPLPFLLFIPGKPRLFATVTIAFLHAGIAMFGNYGTFQLVSLALCIACLDDAQVHTAVNWVRRRCGRAEIDFDASSERAPPTSGWKRKWRRIDAYAGSSLALTAMLCGVLYTARMMEPQGFTLLSNTRWLFMPEAEESVGYAGMRLLRLVAPFFLSYPYGIFRDSPALQLGSPRAGMVFQGTSDGVHWMTYDNKFNPVEPPSRRPQWFAPYQPRMDHLFIYEAVGLHFAYVNGINPYYGARTPIPFLAGRLFEQSDDVLSLFANNPFPDQPPAQLRVRVAGYRFTSPEERARTGEWWVAGKETFIGPVDKVVTAQMIANERDVARKALEQAVDVYEWKRAGVPSPALAYNGAKAWMPPWKFWLAAAPGWLPAGYAAFSAVAALWLRRRRRDGV